MSTRYWFRAKRYGWGWTPVTWQGWAAMTAYVALLLAGSLVVHLKNARPAYLACVVALTVLLLAVCWLKGERPAWRWGDEERRKP